ncbi:hypothetical protein FJT64_014480 [Amphibalanus amphitrite]|uniref:Uncharacterized protein n=1 Tax=Amphibalanus amphitrite TaxID=1232801 RepID=A0A6A4V1H7_AMPAM|nr:hypothetical protein FJT64_014480 [Amphibalanus amphitrite]
MPVATSEQGRHHGDKPVMSVPSSSAPVLFGAECGQAGAAAQTSPPLNINVLHQETPLFGAHSPPVLNLSPGLNPVTMDAHQRMSPTYDVINDEVQSMQAAAAAAAAQLGSGGPLSNQALFNTFRSDDRKAGESPSRKRRRISLSGQHLELTPPPEEPPAGAAAAAPPPGRAASPPPPPAHRRRLSSGRRPPGDGGRHHRRSVAARTRPPACRQLFGVLDHNRICGATYFKSMCSTKTLVLVFACSVKPQAVALLELSSYSAARIV